MNMTYVKMYSLFMISLNDMMCKFKCMVQTLLRVCQKEKHALRLNKSIF